MKFSYRLLKELSGTKKTPAQLEKLLMFHAFEVESVEKYEAHLDDVHIGQVVSVEKHPNADKLNITHVDIGRMGTHRIICGAPNVKAGQKVAVVLPGAVLPGNFKIEEREIRGEKSSGMICSEKELGLGESHEGILVLPEEAPVGALFSKYYGLDDLIFDIKVLPDRASDALSYQGIAREIAALDGYAPEFGETEKKRLRIPAYNRAPKVTILDKKDCNRFIVLHFEGVKKIESPLWLKLHLLHSGMRPKNAVVDITNYLMLLTGQPIHAYDADKISRGLKVRKAKKGEKLKLLTDQTITLDPEDIVIADQDQVLGLAGIMGGKKSAVTTRTKHVVFEIATFDAATIRKSRLRHKLSTDASYRFERGLDGNLPREVAVEATELMEHVCETKLLGMRDEKVFVSRPHTIRLDLDRVDGVLGKKVPLFEVVQYLALLGLKIQKLKDTRALQVTVPTRRADLVDEWNLIEEIARMYGYEKIMPKAPSLPLMLPEERSQFQWEQELKDIAAYSGFSEAILYSFLSESENQLAGDINHQFRLANPLNPNETVLRMSLIPGLLKATGRNTRHATGILQTFEVGKVFCKGGASEAKEHLSFGFVIAEKKGTQDFFTGKALVEKIATHFHLEKRRYKVLEMDKKPVVFERNQVARVMVGEGELGLVGVVSETAKQSLGIPSQYTVIAGELSVEVLFEQRQADLLYQPIQKYPYAVRDISLQVTPEVKVAEIEDIFDRFGRQLLREYQLFDIYEQDGVKRVAFHLYFGDPERTLTSQEMDACFDLIVAKLGEELGGKL